jgi:hypothetical protein
MRPVHVEGLLRYCARVSAARAPKRITPSAPLPKPDRSKLNGKAQLQQQSRSYQST